MSSNDPLANFRSDGVFVTATCDSEGPRVQSIEQSCTICCENRQESFGE